MESILLSLQGAVSQGVLWGIMVLGVYITYKILDIADLTVDGSFALGSCVCATLMTVFHVNPIVAIFCSMIAGMLAGAVTGVLHAAFGIPAILAGILTQISLWSINLRIMGGKSNMPLLKLTTIFTFFTDKFDIKQSLVSLIIGILVAVIIIIFLYWFFGTEIGSSLRATGNNENMIRALGVDIRVTKVIALTLSNGLVGISGALVCQSTKYGDINQGTGAIVIGLAAIVIGDVIFSRAHSFGSKLISAVVGSVIYFVIRALVLQMGMNANDMKMLSAAIVAIALVVPALNSKWKNIKAYNPEGEANHVDNQ